MVVPNSKTTFNAAAASTAPGDIILSTEAFPSSGRSSEPATSPVTGKQENQIQALIDGIGKQDKQMQDLLGAVRELVQAVAVQQSQRAAPQNIQPVAAPVITTPVAVQANQAALPSPQPPANSSPTWKDATDMKSVDVNQWLKSAQEVATKENPSKKNPPKTTDDIDKLKSRYTTYKWGMALCTTVSAVTAVGVAAHYLGMFPGGFTSAAVLAGVGLAAAAANKYFQSNIDNDFDGTVGHECTMALSASTWGEKLTRTATLFHMVRDWNRMPFPSQRLVAFSTGKADQLDTLLEYIHRAGKSAEHWASMEQANGIDGDQYRMFNKPLNDFSADLPRLKSRWGAWPELMLTVSRFSAMAGGIYGVLSLGAVL